MDCQWIDISEYSRNFNLSISTIRRRIKSGQLKTRKERGKYLIRVVSERAVKVAPLVVENERLRHRIQLLQQDIQELKMLVNIYEQKGSSILRAGPPAFPA